jgi:hypothetical protein
VNWRPRSSLIGVCIVAACLHGGSVRAQSFSGLHIGDPLSKIAIIGLEPAAKNRTGSFTMMSWVFPDGNELSVTATTSTGRIVYIESDWDGRGSGVSPIIPASSMGTQHSAILYQPS